MSESLPVLAAAVADEYEADVYLYSGPIREDGFGLLTQEIAAHKQRDSAILILTTHGGVPNAGYQIARMLQRSYRDFWLYCPRRCKSAGTLVALGANRLIMDQFSELGPLDVQLLKPDELGARKSGLLARSTFDALADTSFELYERLMVGIKLGSNSLVSFRLASELSATMASNLLAPVYGQINPEIVGGEHRDLQVATEYGDRLVKRSQNARPGTVHRLVHDYPAHDFIVDDEEARELFKHVDVPETSLYRLVGALSAITFQAAEDPFVCALTRLQGATDDDDADDGGDSDDKGQSGGEGRDGSTVDDRGPANRESDPGQGDPGTRGEELPAGADPDDDSGV